MRSGTKFNFKCYNWIFFKYMSSGDVPMRRLFREPVSSVVIATLERELTKLSLPRLEARSRGNKTIYMLN